MKELFKQYKGALLGFGLAGLLLGLTVALLGTLGERMGGMIASRDYGAYGESLAFQTAAAREGPAIISREETHWTAGEAVILAQAFQARDCEGQELEIEVRQITNEEGEELTDLYQQDGSATFQQPGCYYFLLRTMDSRKKVTMEKRALVIDKKIDKEEA